MKTFTANEYMTHTLFIQITIRTPCTIPLVLQGILKSPYFSTLLIHLTLLYSCTYKFFSTAKYFF